MEMRRMTWSLLKFKIKVVTETFGEREREEIER